MGLLNENTPTPTPLTKEQKIKAASQRLRQSIKKELSELYVRHLTIRNRVQNNPRGLTQQEILNGLGTDKQDFIDIDNKLTELFNLIPQSIKTELDKQVTND